MVSNNINYPQKKLLEYLLSGNRLKSSETVQDYYNSCNSIIEVYESLIKPVMYEVGDMWEKNKISVASEHMASAIVEAILNEFYEEVVSKKKHNKNILLACVENEYHQIGVKMISDVFEMHGWNSHFLGANTPTKDLVDYAKTIKPEIMALSVSLYFNIPVLEKMLSNIRKAFEDMTVLIGGQAFRHGGHEIFKEHKNVCLLHGINEVEQYLNTMINE